MSTPTKLRTYHMDFMRPDAVVPTLRGPVPIPCVDVLIVTGGRTYANQEFVWSALDGENCDLLIHGGATGADALADAWARENEIPRLIFYPSEQDKRRYGKGAWPLRNRDMADWGKMIVWRDGSVRVHVFPGGTGTDGMRSLCLERYLAVLDWRTHPGAQEE